MACMASCLNTQMSVNVGGASNSTPLTWKALTSRLVVSLSEVVSAAGPELGESRSHQHDGIYPERAILSPPVRQVLHGQFGVSVILALLRYIDNGR